MGGEPLPPNSTGEEVRTSMTFLLSKNQPQLHKGRSIAPGAGCHLLLLFNSSFQPQPRTTQALSQTRWHPKNSTPVQATKRTTSAASWSAQTSTTNLALQHLWKMLSCFLPVTTGCGFLTVEYYEHTPFIQKFRWCHWNKKNPNIIEEISCFEYIIPLSNSTVSWNSHGELCSRSLGLQKDECALSDLVHTDC